MSVVVRCTGCSGLARVGPEAVGLLVVCPRCGDPFMADPVPDPVAAAAAPPPPPPPPPRPARAEPVAPPRPRRRRPAEPAPEVHDHAPPTAGGVPFSVIVGLALLPLSIPMLWLLAPLVVGQPPALTVATPVALAVSAAVLCLAVAYTVDWSPVTRIKGVLILVGLAYFAGMSLYFMKRDWAEWAQQNLGPGRDWRVFRAPDGSYEVRLPGKAMPVQGGPVPALTGLAYHQAAPRDLGPPVVYTVGSGKDHDADAADRDWFDAVRQSLEDRGAVEAEESVDAAGGVSGRSWEVVPRNGAGLLLVRVYRDRDRNRVYVLAAQGPDLDPDDDDAGRFFNSFAVTRAKR